MDDDHLIDAWWKGIELWYNQAAYRSAMHVWFEAMDERIGGERTENSTGLLTTPPSINVARILSDVRARDKQVDEMMARFLVFLAGCALDSGYIDKARRYLDESFRRSYIDDSSPNQCVSDNIAYRAAHEYAALFDEDDQCVEPHRMASELFETLFQSSRRAPFLIQSISSKPFYEVDEQPSWCKILEENFAMIQEEFDYLWERSKREWKKVGSGDHRDGAGQHDGNVVDGGDWREVVLFAQCGGHPELAPRTAQLIRDYCSDPVISLAEAGAGEVIFSVLRPGTRILPHTASHNLRLTAHLGLKVPDKAKLCFLRVSGMDHVWERGKVIVFDDSFEHSVVNESDECRAVLLLRFWHPALSKNFRVDCLDKVLKLKEEDGIRRYNPPIPPEGLELRRGMNRSRCTQCLISGFASVRVNIQSKSFFCSCGQPIGE